MREFIIIVLIPISFFGILSYVLYRVFKDKKFIKYIPAIIAMLLSLFFVIKARNYKGEGFSDLVWAIYGMMFMTATIGSLFTSLFLDFIFPRLIKKK